MSKLFTFLSLLFFISSVSAQNVFYKLYDNSGKYDAGFAVKQTLDGGYISCGSSAYPLGAYIVKTAENGVVEWKKYYDFKTGTDDCKSILQLHDSTYIACGYLYDSDENSTSIYLLKLNQLGDTLWLKIVNGGFSDKSIMHFQTEDNGFIIGGNKADSSYAYHNCIIIKTDSIGNIEWEQVYGDSVSDDWPESFEKTPDGGYIIAGDFENDSTSSYDWFLIKTDSLGNQEWRKHYGGIESNGFGSVSVCQDSGYIMAGSWNNGDNARWIVKTNSLGEIEWDRIFNEPVTADYSHDIRQLPDKTFIVTSTVTDTTVSPTRPRIQLMKLDQNGDSLWSKRYTYYGNSDEFGSVTHDYVEDLQLTTDGGFIMTGYLLNSQLPAKNDLFLIKTDHMGNTCEIDTNTWQGCWEYTCTYLNAEFTVQQDTVLFIDSVQVEFTDASAYATEWLWDFGDGLSDTTQDPIHTYTYPGLFQVSLTVSYEDGCTDTITKPIYIEDHCESFSISFGFSLDTLFLSDSTIIHFSSFSEDANWWQWDFGDGGTDSIMNPIHEYDSAGIYIVELTAGNAFCQKSITDTIVVINNTLIQEGLIQTIKLFPNPATNEIVLRSNDKNEFHIVVNDLTGKPVISKFMTNDDNKLDISGLSSGCYFVQIRTSQGVITKKMIKKK